MILSHITDVRLTPGAEIATVRTMKSGFGVIDTDAIMQDRLDTAMRGAARSVEILQ